MRFMYYDENSDSKSLEKRYGRQRTEWVKVAFRTVNEQYGEVDAT